MYGEEGNGVDAAQRGDPYVLWAKRNKTLKM